MIKKEYIIGGIDTDCGKTYVTGMLAKKMIEAGKNLITSKLIQTGCKGISEDIIEHRRLMGVDLFAEDLTGQTCPYVFSYPASPHLAAKIDKKVVNLTLVRDSHKSLLNNYDIVLNEAAGGLMVPITSTYYTIDYIKDNKLPLVLVTSSKLGSINHTLLSFELCLQYQLELPLIIYNKLPGDDEIIAEDTYAFFQKVVEDKFPKTQLIHINDLKELPSNEVNLLLN